jgi:hypothetical protein
MIVALTIAPTAMSRCSSPRSWPGLRCIDSSTQTLAATTPATNWTNTSRQAKDAAGSAIARGLHGGGGRGGRSGGVGGFGGHAGRGRGGRKFGLAGHTPRECDDRPGAPTRYGCSTRSCRTPRPGTMSRRAYMLPWA